MYVNPELTEGVGVVHPPRRANTPRRSPRLSYQGTPASPGTSPNVRVSNMYHAGEAYVAAASFRKARPTIYRPRTVLTQARHRTMSSDLRPIQNYAND